MTTKCILCCRIINPKLGFYNIGDTSIKNSNKTIKSILTHLCKCIKMDYNFKDSYRVCCSCYEQIAEYDKIMVQLLNHQKQLSRMLECSLKFFDKVIDNDNDSKEQNEEATIKTEFEDSNSNFSSTKEVDNGNEMDDNMNDFSSDSGASASAADGVPKRSFDCSICDKSLTSKRQLKTHLELHTTAVKCDICGALSKDEEYLELHMNIHEGKTENDCRYCDKRYSRRANVIRHMQMHWDKKKFQCEKCGFRFSQSYLLYNHKMIHEAEEQPQICPICSQSFKSRKTFKHHMVTHQEDRPMHPCEICGKKFTERYTLKMHLKTHYANPEEAAKKAPSSSSSIKKFSCIICSKVFTTLESLDSHKVKDHDVVCSEGVFEQYFS